MVEIKVFDVEFLGNNSDYGKIYGVTCPVCFDNIQISEFSYDITCSCGYIWSVEICAIGSKFDEED